MTYNIRPYKNEDENELIELWFRSTVEGQAFLSREFWESVKPLIRDVYMPMADSWVAETDGKLLGFISLLDHMIGGLFVDTDQQGNGIGAALIRHAEKVRQQPLSVEVFEKNERARRFYDKCGFSFGEKKQHDETGEIVYILHQQKLL